MQLPLKWLWMLMNGFLLALKTSCMLFSLYVAVKQSDSKCVGTGEMWHIIKSFRMTTERPYAGLICFTKLSMYFLIPSLSLSLLHSSEVLLHNFSSACQSTQTTETHLLQPTLPEQTPVIDLSSPTSLSKWSYYCGESCSTSCLPKIPCLTCLNLFISS